jgi:2-octaprenyl-6-methoxyphenol hydroxylase
MTAAKSSRVDEADILIAGGGLAGLSLGVALKSALGADVAVVVADPSFARAAVDDGRAAAFAAAACRMFRALGAWEAIEPEAQAILDMVVTDSRTMDPVRPVFLTFGGDVAPGEPFAWMAPNAAVLRALRQRADELGVVLLPTGVASFDAGAGHTAVMLTDGNALQASLLVACDGGRSRLREAAGIRTVGWDYGQSGIVCTVAHEYEHNGRAEEHFLPAGPFAILPLKGNRSSIVWTEETGRANRLCALPKPLFLDELETRFGHRLGTIEVVDKPAAYPLGLKVARDFVADRLALVGDAAHVIHPIAGQGINMGFRDVAALAECLAEAMRLGLDPGAPDVLARYQRWRRFDTALMGATTDGLNRLFSNSSEPLRAIRDLGLGLVDRMPRLKDFFVRQAAGMTGDVPRLLRGEAI